MRQSFRIRGILAAVCLAAMAAGGATADALEVWPARPNAPKITLARIQSDLERVAAGKPRWTLPAGHTPDPLERFVDAYAAFLKHDDAAMDAALSEVLAIASARRPGPSKWDGEYSKRTVFEPRLAYFSALEASLAAPLALERLVAGLRVADSVLYLEASSDYAEVEIRRYSLPVGYSTSPMNGTWLRLPCRTVIGRADAFARVAADMGKRAGPLLSCPSRETDFAKLASLAAHPAEFLNGESAAPEVERSAGDALSPQTGPETAFDAIGKDPEGAARQLEAESRRTAGGKLDYALFLHAYRPATARTQAEIAGLLASLLKITPEGSDPEGAKDLAYDGTDASLVPILRWLSVSGAVNTESAYYAIPCAVLLAHPKLLEATESYYAGNKDNFLPRSGCQWGRGEVRGFPSRPVDAFIAAATEADGDFVNHMQGTLVFAIVTSLNTAQERLKVDPRGLAQASQPGQDYPYQVWGNTGVVAHRIAGRIKSAYVVAHDALTAYYVRLGIAPDDAARAAKTGLFDAVLGARCGYPLKTPSIRGMLMDHAPLDAILAQLEKPDDGEAPGVVECGRYAPLDPLTHVAVIYPEALRALLDRGADVDQTNAFRKTPLMAAVQHNQPESVALLLARGAQVNAVTMKEDVWGDGLVHDTRSPLMYAAANASFETIELLLKAGADPYQADSKGRRAVDYLLGYGPTVANAALTPEQREAAVRLLF